jgi:radical SAM superfamily enzyme YgiQ (UPF0313 family)
MKNLRVLLVNPPMQETEKKPPLGLLYVGAVLESTHVEVIIIDANAKDMTFSQIESKIDEYNPEIIGLTAMTPTLGACERICAAAKEKGIMTVVGGSGIIADPVGSLSRFPSIDYGVTGEGERTFPQLLRFIDKRVHLRDLKGVVLRKGTEGTPLMTAPQSHIQNLDEIPFPAYHLVESFDVDDYYAPSRSHRRYMGVITSRGCQNRCIFCDVPRVNSYTVRFRSPESVANEVEWLHARYEFSRLRFWDDTFAQDRKRTQLLCERMKRFQLEWVCSTRVTQVDETLLGLFRESGCYRVEYGIESGDPETLKSIKKGITLDKARNIIDQTVKAGLDVGAFFIIGFPSEDHQKVQHTLDFITELAVEYGVDCSLSIATPYPGTELHEITAKKRLILTDDWSKYTVQSFPVLRTEFLDAKEIWKLYLSFQSRLNRIRETRGMMPVRIASRISNRLGRTLVKGLVRMKGRVD